MPVKIFELLGKSKIPGHALTNADFQECIKQADMNGNKQSKTDELKELFLSIANT